MLISSLFPAPESWCRCSHNTASQNITLYRAQARHSKLWISDSGIRSDISSPTAICSDRSSVWVHSGENLCYVCIRCGKLLRGFESCALAPNSTPIRGRPIVRLFTLRTSAKKVWMSTNDTKLQTKARSRVPFRCQDFPNTMVIKLGNFLTSI